MACSACGKQLAGTTASHQNWQKCSRCKQAFCCNAGCPARALEARRPQAGVQGAHGLQHLRGQRRPAAARPERMRVPGRSGVRARGVPRPGCRAPGIRVPRGVVYMHDVQAAVPARCNLAWRKPCGNADRLCAQNLLASACLAQGRDAKAADVLLERFASESTTCLGGQGAGLIKNSVAPLREGGSSEMMDERGDRLNSQPWLDRGWCDAKCQKGTSPAVHPQTCLEPTIERKCSMAPERCVPSGVEQLPGWPVVCAWHGRGL